MTPRIRHAGALCLLAEFGTAIDRDLNRRVLALDARIAREAWPGVVETVPAYATLAIVTDPLAPRSGEVEARLRAALDDTPDAMAAAEPAPTIPVRYGGAYGPDLGDVARHAGLTPDEVVARHAGAEYYCCMVGFTCGFPYLGGLDPALACPRLPEPRLTVPAGSVAIADLQTGIYPAASPGGWRIIGRTPVALFDAQREPPSVVEPGNTVRFQPIDDHRFERIAQAKAPERTPPPHAHPRLRVVKPGLLTTVQDLGRPGFERYGVPRGGALDPLALRAGNLLAGNDEGAAALEINDMGPELAALDELVIVIAGADLGARVNGERIERWTPLSLEAGDRLTFDGWQRAGHRAYLCVAGGIDVPHVLGSRATYLRAVLGGFGGRALARGDALGTGRPLRAVTSGRPCPRGLVPGVDLDRPLGVIADDAPEADVATFVASNYHVSRHSDRMGFRLEGASVPLAGHAGVLSRPVPPGTIQVTGTGQPIALLADRQTTGGYATLGVLAPSELRQLAQRGGGDAVRFVRTDRDAALDALRREASLLEALRSYVEGS